MPQSLSKIFIQIVFSTKNRVDLIAPEIEDELFRYFHGVIENNGAKLIIANGTANHVHLLISFGKKIDVPEIIGDIKRSSSKWVKREKNIIDFNWQKVYGAFSIGQTQVEMIVKYIENQKEHHRTHDFQDEYRAWLNKYEIDYDERYVWD